ncbi:pilus assembly FimT family protein [Caldimonas brevitalea]|uniref:General secretion pathway protein H n=1 Tax=Caldimonas brevitalea TaxID=413882 RepID=A0A0G3BT73_9BURK|nr:type II secretion system protein [Caldimonas brevitalea]AKJ29725.1 hypothetical protein AAW51_3034 [Caldimonas brevitalea]
MRREAGFTLLEMLVVVAVIAILTSIGAQTLFRSGSELDRQVARVERRLQAARLQARTTGSTVLLPCQALATASNSRLSCRRDGAPLPALAFYPDGSTSGGALDIDTDSDGARLSLDWLSGGVVRDHR